MRLTVLLLTCLPVAAFAADDISKCVARRGDVAHQAAAFSGDEQIKQLIQADIQRAGEEIAEQDTRECNEALDHAVKLLQGKY